MILKHLLDFLYNGEVEIGQEELNNFLETAKALKVKGLESNETKFNENIGMDHSEAIPFPSSFDQLDSQHLEKMDPVVQRIVVKSEELSDSFDFSEAPLVEMKQDTHFSNANTVGNLNVDKVSLVEMKKDTNLSNEITVTNLNVDQMIEKNELNLNVEQIIEKNELVWLCKVCGKTAETPQTKWNLKKHAEKHIKGVSHLCSICGKSWTTSETLRKHMAKAHSDLVFNCDVCQKSGMTLVAFNNHKQKKHSS